MVVVCKDKLVSQMGLYFIYKNSNYLQKWINVSNGSTFYLQKKLLISQIGPHLNHGIDD
jgi:hypothetical protein